MKKLNVQHFLEIYKIRLSMQKDGITNPSQEIKDFTQEIVDKLSELPLDEEIEILGRSLLDSSGNTIVTFPNSD
jgi:hypothetical protein